MYRFENGKRYIGKTERTVRFVLGMALFLAAFVWSVRALFGGVML